MIKPTANKVLPQAGVTGFYDTFVLNLSLVFQINSTAKNPPLPQTPNVRQNVNMKRNNKTVNNYGK
jgi:hypothetical protein